METRNLQHNRRSRSCPTVETLTEHRISPRVVLRPGDRFQVSGGPYYRTSSGEKIPMAVRGACRLVAVYRERSRVYLLASARDGMAVLHVAGRRRNRMIPGLVCRPYVVKRKIRNAIALRKPIA